MNEWFSTHAFLGVVIFLLVVWLLLEGLRMATDSEKADVCGKCWGEREIPNSGGMLDDWVTCPQCNGTGKTK